MIYRRKFLLSLFIFGLIFNLAGCTLYKSAGRKFLEGEGTAGLVRIARACHVTPLPSTFDLENAGQWVLIENHLDEKIKAYRSEMADLQMLVVSDAEPAIGWCQFDYPTTANYVELAADDIDGARSWLADR